MAGYVSDSECIRYRMNRDMGYDRLVHPKHPRRYEYREGNPWMMAALVFLPFVAMLLYMFYMLLDPANWWMW